jgi:hypothetical protein
MYINLINAMFTESRLNSIESLMMNIPASFGTEANWIWPWKFKDKVNQYVLFNHVFHVETPDMDGELLISSESNFTVFLNDVFVASGQFHDFPGEPTYSKIVLKGLRTGDNTLTIRGYHFGVSHSAHISSTPSLIYMLSYGDVCIGSGTDTRYRLDPAYRSGELDRITCQMGFVFEYDARYHNNGDKEWQLIESTDIVERPMPSLRPLPMPKVGERTSMQIMTQGRLIRNKESDEKSIGELMQSDFLSSASVEEIFLSRSSGIDSGYSVRKEVLEKHGVYLIIDMEREECGYIALDIEAPSGTVVDIAVGQHLDDMRVRSHVGGRNFASRYICGSGRQFFIHHNNRYSGRYLQLNIPRSEETLNVFYAGLLPVEYPVKTRGNFSSGDPITDKIYETCGRTLHLCMHEHYEDTPWREQALYANDARNQALAGYYVFGEREFPRVSFDLLGKSVRSDDFVAITAPSDVFDFCIPSFTFSWFMGMRDLLMFTGNESFLESYIPQIRRMLKSLSDTCDDGLLPCPRGTSYWHFYDWEDGLDGVEQGGWLNIQSTRYDAPLNLFFILSLQAVACILQYLGHKGEAEELLKQAENVKERVIDMFWDNERQLFRTYVGRQGRNNHFCELTQALAILADLGDTERLDHLRRCLIDDENDLVKTSLSQSFYKYQALFQGAEQYGQWAFNDIRKKWSYMLYHGATSFWETLKGQADFDNAGSLCHGWSAIPAYFFHAYLLGIVPLEPGFKTFTVRPVLGILDRVKGSVLTPYGVIDVDINWADSKIKIVHPKQTAPVYDLDKTSFNMNVKVRKI